MLSTPHEIRGSSVSIEPRREDESAHPRPTAHRPGDKWVRVYPEPSGLLPPPRYPNF